MTALSADWTSPESRRDESVTNTYHGTSVADPYRWLEDLDSEETTAWVAAQNAASDTLLKRLPLREPFHDRLSALLDYDYQSVYAERSGWLFFYQRLGLQDHAVYCRRKGLEGEIEALIDPNTLSADKTTSLAFTAVSQDTRYLAYGLSDAGSDWRTVHVKDLESGENLADVLSWVKFSSVSWTRDSKGFFYSRFPAPDEKEGEVFADLANQAVYYHRLGTAQSEDVLIHARPDEPKFGVGSEVTFDGRWLIVYEYDGTNPQNGIRVADLGDPEQPKVDAPLVAWNAPFTSDENIIGTVGDKLLVLTDLNAPTYRGVLVDPLDPDPANWQELIPATEHVLQGLTLAGGEILATTLEHVKSKVRRYDPSGTLLDDLPLPGIGSLAGLTGRPDLKTVYFGFTSFTTPSQVWRYPLGGKAELVFTPETGIELDAYESKQVFVASKDGTKVPMFLVRKKGLARDGSNPVLLSAYGGFNISLLPRFASSRIPWLERGGIIAIPNLRGGGEYGRDWHEAGMLGRKQNVFDDFIAAAEWLIDQKWTSSEHLAIRGGSNGGLLVGACMCQRPELYAAAVPAVGVMDMLRFHTFTIGHAWVPEYGSSDNAADFQWLHAYSPLHNLRPGSHYPATIVTTGDHDDRVHPGHSFKFAAALQHAQAGPAPTLIRIETDSGHGAGLALNKHIDAEADILAFLAEATGMK